MSSQVYHFTEMDVFLIVLPTYIGALLTGIFIGTASSRNKRE